MIQILIACAILVGLLLATRVVSVRTWRAVAPVVLKARIPRISPASALAIAAVVCLPVTATADLYQVTIQNGESNGSDATDLHVSFKLGKVDRGGPLVNPKPGVVVSKDPTLPPDEWKKGGSTGGNNGGTDFPPGTFPDIPSGKGKASNVYIRYDSRTAAVVDVANSKWTPDNTPITVVGFPMRVNPVGRDGDKWSGLITFDNLGDVAITYSDIEVYGNNDLSGFALEHFTQPTGVLWTGIPSSVTVDPGESRSFSFDGVDVSKYVLVLANVATVNDPTNTFSLATGAMIPEPKSVVTLAIGAICLGACCLRRRSEATAPRRSSPAPSA